MSQENYKLDVAFDVIPLPSGGIFYESGKDSLKVSYLTAADENILTSQNLIEQGNVIEELLRAKIIDKDIDVLDLHDIDKEAVLLFLRNTAYGPNITLVVTDPETSKKEEVELDLTTLKYKDFKLVKNKNGLYEYTLPISKKKIEFKYLTRKEEVVLENIEESYKDLTVKPTITKRLELMIKSIDGETDPMRLSHLISQLPIKDSQEFRRYSNENLPGIDKGVEVTLPSGKKIQTFVNFGPEFFRPFFGL